MDEGLKRGGERASFNRAHDSRAVPNADAADERAESASRYALAVESRSVYAS